MTLKFARIRRVFLSALCLAAVFTAASAKAQVTEGEEPAAEQQLIVMLNQERALHGLPALKENPRLLRAALQHGQKMAQAAELSHQFPGEPALAQRISDVGIGWDHVGENVGFASDWPGLNSGWIHSPPHHKNMLDPAFTEVGIAVVRRGNLYYGVQDFARVIEQRSPEDAEARLGQALQALRPTSYHTVTVKPDVGIRRAMCSMAERDKVSAADLAALHLGSRVFTFTAFDPAQVPPSLHSIATGTESQVVYVGACFQKSKTYTGGVYWIGVVY